MLRDMEREIIPMCRHFGMAIAPWDVLGGGKLQSKAAMEERKKNNEGLRSMMGGSQTETEIKMSEVCEAIAKEHGLESPTVVALAYVMSKATHVFPLVGGRKVSHLKENIKALDIKLTTEQIQKIEAVTNFEPGFPNNFVGEDPAVSGQAPPFVGAAAPMSFVSGSKPIGHE